MPAENWSVSNLNIFFLFVSMLLPEPSGLEAAEETLFLYLRHLGEEADGQGQGEAEGQQTHEAVDGQHQPAVTLQEPQPKPDETETKGKCEASVWICPRLLLPVHLGCGGKHLG